jgi:hypothetical protein
MRGVMMMTTAVVTVLGSGGGRGIGIGVCIYGMTFACHV